MMDVYEQGKRLPDIIQIRPDMLLMYPDSSFFTHNRKGKTACLRQNQTKTKYWEKMRDLNKKDLLGGFDLKYKKRPLVDNWAYWYNRAYRQDQALKLEDEGYYIRPLGELSRGQLKQMRRITDCMFDTVKATKKPLKRFVYGSKEWLEQARTSPYLTFLTLTLSSEQIHTDKVIRRMLNRFLKRLRRYGVVFYIWKMEAQENGRAHFHLIVDRFIDKGLVQKWWNKAQKSYGYLDEYYKKKGHWNAPSTKIEKPNNRYDLGSYLLKGYLTKQGKKGKKNQDVRPIIGQLWGASNEAKRLDYLKIKECDSEDSAFFNYLVGLTYKKVKEINRKTSRVETVDALQVVVYDDYIKAYNGKVYKYIKGAFWGRLMAHYKGVSAKLSKDCRERLEWEKIKGNKPKAPPLGAVLPKRKPRRFVIDDQPMEHPPPPPDGGGVNIAPLVAF